MAKKWSDVAASSAFQALSFDEQEEARRQYFEQIIAPQVPEEDVALARDQFFADTTRNAGGGRGVISPLPAPATDYSDMATAMQGTPAPAPTKGIIQRVGEFLRPAPQRSVLDQPAPPEE